MAVCVNYNVEFLRLAAAFGIVVFHAGDVTGRLSAYSGLIIFVILFTYFIPKSTKCGIDTALANRIRRLIIPWMAWSVVYGMISIMLGRSFYNYPDVTLSVILTGTSVHLWFLPFAFLSSSLIIILESTFPFNRHFPMLFGILSLLSLPIMSYWWRMTGDMPIPFNQWRHALPAVFIGLFLRYCRSRRMLLFFTAAIVTSSLYASGIGSDSYGTPYVIGVLSCVLCLFSPNVMPERITKYTKDAYGIYLVHPVFYILAWINNIKSSFLLALAVFSLSFLLAHYLRKLPYSRFYC